MIFTKMINVPKKNRYWPVMAGKTESLKAIISLYTLTTMYLLFIIIFMHSYIIVILLLIVINFSGCCGSEYGSWF